MMATTIDLFGYPAPGFIFLFWTVVCWQIWKIENEVYLLGGSRHSLPLEKRYSKLEIRFRFKHHGHLFRANSLRTAENMASATTPSQYRNKVSDQLATSITVTEDIHRDETNDEDICL